MFAPLVQNLLQSWWAEGKAQLELCGNLRVPQVKEAESALRWVSLNNEFLDLLQNNGRPASLEEARAKVWEGKSNRIIFPLAIQGHA